MSISRFFDLEDYFPSNLSEEEHQIDPEEYIQIWCLKAYAKQHNLLHLNVNDFHTNKIFQQIRETSGSYFVRTHFKNELITLELLAYSALKNNTLTCDLVDAAKTLNLSFPALCNSQYHFGVLKCDEKCLFSFPDTKTRDYFAALFFLSCYTQQEPITGEPAHQWQDKWGSFHEEILSVLLPLNSNSFMEFIFAFQPDELTQHAVKFKQTMTNLSDLIKRDYKIDLMRIHSTELCLRLSFNIRLVLERQVSNFSAFVTQLQTCLASNTNSHSITFQENYENNNNIEVAINGPANLLNLLEERLKDALTVTQEITETNIQGYSLQM